MYYLDCYTKLRYGAVAYHRGSEKEKEEAGWNGNYFGTEA